MKHSLSKRLFAITLSLISGIMILVFFSQAIFFEKFYSYKKTRSLVNEVSKFRDLYSLHIDSSSPKDKGLYNALKKFEEDTNSQIAITSLNGDILYISSEYNGDSIVPQTLASFCIELINNRDLINDVIKNSTIRYTNFYSQSNGMKKIGVVSPMSLQRKNDSLIFCVASIQPIEEASEDINEFFFFLFFALIVVAAMLALIYSNMVSKPLVTLTYVAD